MQANPRLIPGLALYVAVAVHGQTPQLADNAVILWNNAAMDAARENNAGTVVMVRALAEMHTAMLDAWAQLQRESGFVLLRQYWNIDTMMGRTNSGIYTQAPTQTTPDIRLSMM